MKDEMQEVVRATNDLVAAVIRLAQTIEETLDPEQQRRLLASANKAFADGLRPDPEGQG